MQNCDDIKNWCMKHEQEATELLEKLVRIPAPTGGEADRATFIKDWYDNNCFGQAFIDATGNVLLPIGDLSAERIRIVAAHIDTVFTDMQPFLIREYEDKLYAPGIGDDTANLVNMMMAAKFASERGFPRERCILLAATVGEEGLGNLKGSKAVVSTYRDKTESFVSLDLYAGCIVSKAVGSHRYRITIRTVGGHSYGDFGNANAIAVASEMITELYRISVPDIPKTTYNVGRIEGGTTVNSISSECIFLYEYRSEDRECLWKMKKCFNAVVDNFRKHGLNIEVEQIGDRPCTGDVDRKKQLMLSEGMRDIMEKCGYSNPEMNISMSTDCNSALAEGIPSVCIGTIRGGGAHTREEWIDKNSICRGMQIAIYTVLMDRMGENRDMRIDCCQIH